MVQKHYRNYDFNMLKMSYTGAMEEDDECFHNFHEIFYVAEGECMVYLGHEKYLAESGSLVTIPAGTIHKTAYRSAGINTKFVLSFSRKTGSEIDTFLKEDAVGQCMKISCVEVPLQRREYVENLMNRMLFEFDEKPEHSAGVIKVYLAQVLISLVRYRNKEEENSGRVDSNSSIMQAIARHINENYDQQLSLEELAGIYSMSPSSLSRNFKAATGFGLKEYIINVRIKKASELLLGTERNITDIAQSCGFNDSNYFGDAFKKATGLSPRAYRQMGLV